MRASVPVYQFKHNGWSISKDTTRRPGPTARASVVMDSNLVGQSRIEDQLRDSEGFLTATPLLEPVVAAGQRIPVWRVPVNVEQMSVDT
jgi:hypothetical protein